MSVKTEGIDARVIGVVEAFRRKGRGEISYHEIEARAELEHGHYAQTFNALKRLAADGLVDERWDKSEGRYFYRLSDHTEDVAIALERGAT